tara:strand:- start:69435 stop:69821 length:387 start_codon:yes stop_codon:yes gene_type:complete
MKQQTFDATALFKDENMAIKHCFTLGSAVRYIDSEPLLEEDSLENRLLLNAKSLFVVSQDRDCDGTPLYTLSTLPFNSKQEAEDYILNEVIGNRTLYKLSQTEQLSLIVKTQRLVLFNGINQENLAKA